MTNPEIFKPTPFKYEPIPIIASPTPKKMFISRTGTPRELQLYTLMNEQSPSPREYRSLFSPEIGSKGALEIIKTPFRETPSPFFYLGSRLINPVSNVIKVFYSPMNGTILGRGIEEELRMGDYLLQEQIQTFSRNNLQVTNFEHVQEVPLAQSRKGRKKRAKSSKVPHAPLIPFPFGVKVVEEKNKKKSAFKILPSHKKKKRGSTTNKGKKTSRSAPPGTLVPEILVPKPRIHTPLAIHMSKETYLNYNGMGLLTGNVNPFSSDQENRKTTSLFPMYENRRKKKTERKGKERTAKVTGREHSQNKQRQAPKKSSFLGLVMNMKRLKFESMDIPDIPQRRKRVKCMKAVISKEIALNNTSVPPPKRQQIKLDVPESAFIQPDKKLKRLKKQFKTIEGIVQESKPLSRYMKNKVKKQGEGMEDIDQIVQEGKDSSLGNIKCKRCGKVFTFHSQLGGHMSKVHPGESTSYSTKKNIYENNIDKRARLNVAKRQYLLEAHHMDFDLMMNTNKGRENVGLLIAQARTALRKIKPTITDLEITEEIFRMKIAGANRKI